MQFQLPTDLIAVTVSGLTTHGHVFLVTRSRAEPGRGKSPAKAGGAVAGGAADGRLGTAGGCGHRGGASSSRRGAARAPGPGAHGLRGAAGTGGGAGAPARRGKEGCGWEPARRGAGLRCGDAVWILGGRPEGAGMVLSLAGPGRGAGAAPGRDGIARTAVNKPVLTTPPWLPHAEAAGLLLREAESYLWK